MNPAAAVKAGSSMDDDSWDGFSFLAADVGKAKGLLAVVLNLQLFLLVKPDFAQWCKSSSAFPILVHIEHHDTKGIVTRARPVIQLSKRDRPVGHQHDMLSAIWRRANTDDPHSSSHASSRCHAAFVFHARDDAQEPVLRLLLQGAKKLVDFAIARQLIDVHVHAET